MSNRTRADGAVSDEVVIAAVGLGVGAWALARYKSGEGLSTSLPFLGGSATLPSIDLSGLLGGINIGDLGDGGLLDAVRTWIEGQSAGGNCPQGGGAPAGLPETPAQGGGGGAEPSFPWDFTPGGGLFGGATGLVQAVGELSPVTQGFVGAGLGAIGGATGYLMVRTAPAVARLAGGAASGILASGRAAGGVLSAGARALVARWSASRLAASVGGTRAAQVRTVTRYVLPAVGKRATMQTAGVIGAVAVLPFIAASVTTFTARIVEALSGGRYDPEQSLGWGALSSMSLVDWLMDPGVARAAEFGAAYEVGGPFEGVFGRGGGVGSVALPVVKLPSAASIQAALRGGGSASAKANLGGAGSSSGAAGSGGKVGAATGKANLSGGGGGAASAKANLGGGGAASAKANLGGGTSGKEPSFQSPYSMV